MEVVFDEVVDLGTQSYKGKLRSRGEQVPTISTIMNVRFAWPTSFNYFALAFPLPDTLPLSLDKLVEAPADSEGSCSSGIGGVTKEQLGRSLSFDRLSPSAH